MAKTNDSSEGKGRLATWWTRQRSVGWGRRLLLFSLCVAVATLLWFFNRLSQSYTLEINYPVEVVVPTAGLTLRGGAMTTVTVRVQGAGYLFARYGASGFPVAKLYVPNRISAAQDTCRFSRDDISLAVAQALPGSMALLSVQNDSYSVAIVRLSRRKIPVRLDAKFALGEQCMLFSPPVPSEDSVTAWGAWEDLRTLREAATETIQLGTLHRPTRIKLPLCPPPGVRFSPAEVEYDIPVQVFTQRSFEIPIRIVGDTKGGRVRVAPSIATLTCLVPVAKYDSIRAGDFSLEVRIPRNDEGHRLLVELKGDSKLASRIEFQPQYVDYIIEHE